MIKGCNEYRRTQASPRIVMGTVGRDDVLVDQAPDGIDNRKRQLIHIQFNRILHEDIGPLLPRCNRMQAIIC